MNAYLSFTKLLLFYLEEALVQRQFMLHSERLSHFFFSLLLITYLFELSFCSPPSFHLSLFLTLCPLSLSCHRSVKFNQLNN